MSKTAVNDMAAAIYQMAHASGVTIEQGADMMGIKSTYLYRLLNVFDTRANLPAVLLSPAMHAFKNISPLSWLNSQHGLVAVKPPRGAANRTHSITDLQLQFNDLVRALLVIDNHFNEQTKKEVLDTLKTVLKSICSLKLSVQKYSNQLELRL